MLDTLSVYFLAFPVESLAVGVSRDIGRHKGYIDAALPVLCALHTMTFTSEQPCEGDADLLAVEPDDGFVKLKVLQKMRKRNHQKPRATIDVSFFDKLGVAIPRTSEEATLWSVSILAELKVILSVSILALFEHLSLISSHKFYLSLLRKTELAGDIKALLLLRVEESGKDVAPEISSTEGVDNHTRRPGAYPMVQPMKAALYFDNANRFGEWRILISTEAGRNLREFRRTNREILKIIVKKIELVS